MKAPKCRLCGHEHWLNESHVFPDDKPAPKPKRPVVADKPVVVADRLRDGGGQPRSVVADRPQSGGGQKAKVVADKPGRKADRHINDKARKAKEKWRKRIKRNPAKASEAGQALMQSINAEITSWH